MFALVAHRMGYRVHVYSREDDGAALLADVSISASYEDLDRVREFAAGVDVVTVAESNVPLIALQAAERSGILRPSASVFEAIENGVGAKVDSIPGALAEFSVIGARGVNGECAFYPPIAIDHVASGEREGAIDIARWPAPIGARVVRQAVGLTRDMLEDLDLTGILCVEFILTGAYELLVREATPHPHSLGHLTVAACVTSQFEQQLRAVCGLPLGSTEMLRPAAMAILWETIWQNGEPDWLAACALPEVKLYLYGVRGGHLTATAASGTRAKQIVKAARMSLNKPEAPQSKPEAPQSKPEAPQSNPEAPQ
jgi:phosphoribosylaminoimidazole carboxylase (NCAIR synthetase)